MLCLPWLFADTPLYSEEQARGSLNLPSADLETANDQVKQAVEQFNLVSRQNADLRNEVLSYRDIVKQTDEMTAENQKKDDQIRRMGHDIDELFKKIAATKNYRALIEDQKREIAASLDELTFQVK